MSVGSTNLVYDAAGQLTTEGANTDVYDGEGRLTYQYITNGVHPLGEEYYNALGARVQRYNGASGHWTTIYNDPWGNETQVLYGSTTQEIYLPAVAGRHYAMYMPNGSSGTTYFTHANALGSTGTITDNVNTGLPAQELLYYPWGWPWTYAGSNPHGWYIDMRFAGMNPWDPQIAGPEVGYSPTPNRAYYGLYNRWTTPDPLAGDVGNPQSLNRYAYALNNPTTFIDPLGLQCVDDGHGGVTDDGTQPKCAFAPTTTTVNGGSADLPVCVANGSEGCIRLPGALDSGHQGPTGSSSGSSGGGSGTISSIVSAIKSAACSAIPEGRTTGFGGAAGVYGGPTGTLEIIINYNTGEVSGFASGGGFAGFNGGLSGNFFSGFIRNLGSTNANYSGPFSTAAGSLGPGGAFVSATTSGLNNPLKIVPNGAQVAGASIGLSLFGRASLTGAVTDYTKPLYLGNLLNGNAPGALPFDFVNFAARQACK